MALNKNQHFVPRCYLRSFCEDGGRRVNLFNLDRSLAVPGAAVRSQCSGDYFYGQDLQIEKRLQLFEGQYAQRLSAIVSPGYRLNEADRAILKQFWLLQYLRTDAAARRSVEMFDQAFTEIGKRPENFSSNIKYAVQMAVSIFFDQRDLVEDLNVCLINNISHFEFVTSDNPAILTNKWYVVDPRAEGSSIGLKNAGLLGFLPLSPRVMCVIYDGAVYSMPHVGGWIVLSDETDAESYNEQQVLHCQANIYFSDWQSMNEVERLALNIKSRRPESRHQIEHFVADRKEPGREIYRKVSSAFARTQQGGIVRWSYILPRPSRWPSQIRWRSGGHVFESGTGEGFVRRHARYDPKSYKKLKLRT